MTAQTKRTYTVGALLERPGIRDARGLPDSEFRRFWDSIVTAGDLKDRLLNQSVLSFTLRHRLPRAKLPLHGIVLLVGDPGTGKTSLAKGLASRVAESLRGIGTFTYIEVDPHSLGSASLGRTQKAVSDLFATTIAECAAAGPTIVLLDEVETIVADRARLSLEANPIDVHRATDAALVQLDHLAADRSNLLIIATSNFQGAIDSAFMSRCDMVQSVPLPDEEACEAILVDTIEAMAKEFPAVAEIPKEPDFKRAVKAAVGMDGRQLRKLIARACAVDRAIAIDPGRLDAAALLVAAKSARTDRTEKRR